MFRKTVQFHEESSGKALKDAMLQGEELEKEALRELAPCLKNNPELQKLRAKTFIFGGGKGGVGKSLAAINLGLTLASAGRNVLILDFDPAPKVLEALNGKRAHSQNVEEFRIGAGRLATLSIIQTSGVKEFLKKDLSLLNNTNGRLYEFINNLLGAGHKSTSYYNSFDIVFIDVGAGNALLQTIPNFLFNKTIVITTLEPTARLDAYMYMRTIAAQNTRQRQDFYLAFNCAPDLGDGNYEKQNKELENLEKQIKDLENLPKKLASKYTELVALRDKKLEIVNNIKFLEKILTNINSLWEKSIRPHRPNTAVQYSGYIPYSAELAAMPYLSRPRPALDWFAGMSRRIQEMTAAGP